MDCGVKLGNHSQCGVDGDVMTRQPQSLEHLSESEMFSKHNKIIILFLCVVFQILPMNLVAIVTLKTVEMSVYF